MLRIVTLNGSTYEIDLNLGQWKRTAFTAESGPLIKDHGNIISCTTPRIGKPWVCQGDGKVWGSRRLETSKIISIEEINA